MDTGCPEVSPSCLRCPLPACRYDDVSGYLFWKKHGFTKEHANWAIEAMKPREAARYLGVSLRTINRMS